MNKVSRSNKILSILIQLFLIATIFLAIFVSWNKYYNQKNFEFVLEAPCDIDSEICYIRSCMNEGDYCPPNNLQAYRVLVINARDFDQCTNNSCLDECTSGQISCKEIICEESENVSCSQ